MGLRAENLLVVAAFCAVFLLGCGSSMNQEISFTKKIAESNGWMVADSPYILPPGETVAVCDTGVKEGVLQHVMNAMRAWLDSGKRDGRIQVVKGCDGSRVIKLVRAPDHVLYRGQAWPLKGNVNMVEVANGWLDHWTANHEIGHIFGFAHPGDEVSSVMQSNPRLSNQGHLSEYDLNEVKRILERQEFKKVNALWEEAN